MDIDDLIPLFLQSMRNNVDVISSALNSADYKSIRICGHNMAGCGSGYGFPEITEIGRMLEAAALATDKNSIQAGLARLINLLNNIGDKQHDARS